MDSVELCAGAGGQALGLELAGFSHRAAVEIDEFCQATLRYNRPEWNVQDGPQADVTRFDASHYKGIDLLAGGLPCPPFSVAGQQLGDKDERNLFPHAIRIIDECKPKAVMIENVRGFLDPVFADYRDFLRHQFARLGYHADWRLFNASDFGVSQLRPRVVIIAIRNSLRDRFVWPSALHTPPTDIGTLLRDLMSADGWQGADAWAQAAKGIAPTLVGGSKKHGGPDLGPTRARKAWALLGVDGKGVADNPPAPDFSGMPRLTVRMAARVQGFPDDWHFVGRKTAAYRQVGNAFPPPVAHAVGVSISSVLGETGFVGRRIVNG